MSMPRDPLFRVGEPSHNLIPQAEGAIWYPLHDSSFSAGISGLPILVETVSGSASGSKWTTPGFYTFPDANGGTDDVVLIATEDENDLYLNSVLSLLDTPVGGQIIVGIEASYDDVPTGNSALWGYGRNSAVDNTTLLCLDITSAEAVRFARRARGGTTSTATLTASSGTFASLRNAGPFACFLSITMVSATTADIELRASNGTNSCYYTSLALSMIPSGTHLPGFDASAGMLMAEFVGLSIGARNGATGPDAYWGNGGTNTGKVGNFQARQYTAFDAARLQAKLAKQLARPRDFVLED